MNLAPAPLQYLRDVWQGILNELFREDQRNVKRDVAETFNGTLTVAGTLTPQGQLDISGSNAGQIKFPVTQNASSDANTLDDYEEFSFTPTLGDGTNNYTLDRAVGLGVKIGRLVHIDIACRWTSIGSAGVGQLRVKTLPYPSNSTTGYQVGASVGYTDDLDTTATLNQLMGYIGTNSTEILLYRAADNAGAAALPANSSGATGEIVLSVTYMV